jgi:serine/threonine-protein kinase
LGILASQVTGRRYRLLAALARGGMGEVFVGEELGPKASAQPRVAIKTLLPDAARDATMLSRFLDEARLSARLSHPCVARMLDFGQAAGRPFAVFELLRGADLGECLDALIARGRSGPVEVALAVAMQACQGLHHAHTLEKDGKPLQVVHRDLSPSNLFVCDDGQAKVLDFGAAWGRDRFTQTATNMIIGKVEYMAPEQVHGKPVDARTDVFALGLCLHESLTLKRPYAGFDEREQVRRIFEAEVPRLEELRPGLPRALYAVVRKALAKSHLERFGSAQELGEALLPLYRAQTSEAPQARLQRFFAECFGPERTERREARLRALQALPVPDATQAFRWEAPSLHEQVQAVALGTSDLRSVSEPAPLRGVEPETDPDDRPPAAAPTAVLAAKPASGARAKASTRAALLVGAAVLAALLLGVAIGHLGATLGR